MKTKIAILILFLSFSAVSQAELENPFEIRDFFAGDRHLKAREYNRAIEAYQKFMKYYPESRYKALSYLQIAGIYQDYLHDYVRAKELYEKILSLPSDNNRLTEISKKMAKRWLEKVGGGIIEEALKNYYIREVEYPGSLDELVDKGYLKKENLIDSWRKDYLYQPKHSSLFPKFKQQEYLLIISPSNEKRETKTLSISIKEKKNLLHRFSLQKLQQPENKALIKYKPPSGPSKTEWLKEGEKIGGAEVLAITKRGAILEGEYVIIILTKF